ncbi:MAG: chemotaxis response regulator protein-glutamate methylesterase [Rhodospirillales bacterium]
MALDSSDDAIRVMVVDDSAVVRGLITRILEDDPQLSVTVSAANGLLAVEGLSKNEIDVIVLDIEMPVMDGLTALPKLLEVDPEAKIVMASTLTARNADISLRALAAGATDYVSKPTSSREIMEGGGFRRELIEKVRNLGLVRRKKAPVHLKPGQPSPTRPRGKAPPSAMPSRPVVLRNPGSAKPDILAIGSSTGGPQALFAMLKVLKPDIKIPVVITQHMPAKFTSILAQHITRMTGWSCSEATDGDKLTSGHIHIAPGDYHMTVEREGTNRVVRLDQEPPENFCRPAVDPMFRSTANIFGERVLAVVLTGMGYDGAKGGQTIAEAGGTVIAQDEETSVVWGMPGAAAHAGICSAVLPLGDIAPYITRHASRGG